MKQLLMVAVISLLSLLFFADTSMAKLIDEHIYIVPVGQIDKKTTEGVKNGFSGFMPMSVRVEISQPKDVPQAAYDSSRKQYNAETVLYEISQRMTIDIMTERVLVITDVDLYAPGSDFVLGSANAKKGICIISLARLKKDDKLFLERVSKQAIYEFGVSRGLDNCSNLKCVMNSSNNLADIDKKKHALCHDCRNNLLHRYVNPLFNASLKSLI
ncbi:MAG: archaemetzincin [Candidatus Omnitrophota bacterium]|jgi:archaemetzincin